MRHAIDNPPHGRRKRPSDAEWGRVTYICVGNQTIIGSDNGLSPGRRQAITWTNVAILLIGPPRSKLRWNVNRNSYIFIQENPFENVVWKMAAILSRPQCVNWYWKYIDVVLNVCLHLRPYLISEKGATPQEDFSVRIGKLGYYIPLNTVGCNYISVP